MMLVRRRWCPMRFWADRWLDLYWPEYSLLLAKQGMKHTSRSETHRLNYKQHTGEVCVPREVWSGGAQVCRFGTLDQETQKYFFFSETATLTEWNGADGGWGSGMWHERREPFWLPLVTALHTTTTYGRVTRDNRGATTRATVWYGRW